MTIRRIATAIALGATLLLYSCGGGGGGGGGGDQTPPNNWDSMVWDQGSWG